MNEMKFTGRIKVIMPETSGVSNAGNAWTNQQIVVSDSSTQYEKNIVIDAYNKVDEMSRVKEGDAVTCWFNVGAREHNGKWYGSNKLWKFTFENQQQQAQQQQQHQQQDPGVSNYAGVNQPVVAPPIGPSLGDEDSGLPF